MATDTRHLDRTIAILQGTSVSYRAKRKAQVTLQVYSCEGIYTIQANGKTVELGNGTLEYANTRAMERAEAIRALGKTCIMEVSK